MARGAEGSRHRGVPVTISSYACWGCEQFKVGSRGSYSADCKECAARSLAQSPEHFESAQAGAMTPRYRSALQRVFGVEWKQGHERVKAWSERLKGKT